MYYKGSFKVDPILEPYSTLEAVPLKKGKPSEGSLLKNPKLTMKGTQRFRVKGLGFRLLYNPIVPLWGHGAIGLAHAALDEPMTLVLHHLFLKPETLAFQGLG